MSPEENNAVQDDKIHLMRRLSRSGKWQGALALSGLVYVALILIVNLSSPVLSIMFVVLAGYQLIHRR